MEGEDYNHVKPKDRKSNRRSSFFRKSLSSFNSVFTDSPTDTGVTLLPEPGDVTTAKENNSIEYLNRLSKEKEDWDSLSNQKKKQEEELRNKQPRAVLSEKFLSDEDKKFLADRPDFTAIGRLLDNVTEAVAIKEMRINRTLTRVDNMLTLCERISQKMAEKVIDRFMDGYEEFGITAPASSSGETA